MSTIKDKPLKKIVCDTRVKIDSLHNDKIKDISINSKHVSDINNKIKQLNNDIINSSDKNYIIQLENELNLLKNKLKNYEEDEYTKYYLDNGLLLSKYYDNNNNNNNNNNNKSNKKEKSILDFMKQDNKIEDDEKHNDGNYSDIVKLYMINIDNNIINNCLIDDINVCKRCNNKLTMIYNDSELCCDKCGFTKHVLINIESNSYKDPIRESTYFAYKRSNHFNEWLAQFQAKETNDISEDIINNILKELKKDKSYTTSNINYTLIRNILKKLNYNKYYEHIYHIMYIITGKKCSTLDRNTEEQLRNMFKDIQNPFQKHCPPDRKNFLSYSYVLHKFCELLELKEFLTCFPYLKSNEKLRQQDAIWKNICKELKWEYIPSI